MDVLYDAGGGDLSARIGDRGCIADVRSGGAMPGYACCHASNHAFSYIQSCCCCERLPCSPGSAETLKLRRQAA
mgnify:CR=1 FL=1